MNFLEENTVLILVITSIVTLLLVIVATLYTIRNASKLRSANGPNVGKNAKTEESKTDTESEEHSKPLPLSESLESNGDPTDDQNNTGVGEKQPARKQVIDPVQYCEHIQSEVKKARQRVATREIQQNLTEEDVIAEREAQRKQLEDIFKLMERQNDKFGVNEMDEVYQQMKLYA